HDKENEGGEEESFYDAKDNLSESEMKSDKGDTNKVDEQCKSSEINENKNNVKQKDVFSLRHTFLNHVDNLKEKTKKINDSIKNIYENNENMFLKNLFTSQKKTDKDNFDNNKDCGRDKNFDLRNIEYKHLYEKKNNKRIRKRDIFFESILKDGKLNNIDKIWNIKNINKLKSPLKILEKNSKKMLDAKNSSKRRSLSCNNFNHENNLFKNFESNEDANSGYKKGINNGNINYENNQFVNSINEKGNLYYKNKKNELTYNKKESIPAIFVNNTILEPKVDVNEKRESVIIKNYEECINNNLNFNESVKQLCENVVSENSSDESHSIKNVDKGNVVAIVGTQWGDEGKGKIIDILSKYSNITCRFNGGGNAGHTICVGDKKHALHLLPCGVLYENNVNVLGNCMVIHLKTLMKEINNLGNNILDRIYISEKAHILFDIHQEIDAIQEIRKSKDGNAIGTTKKGIGPCYSTKASRIGIRMGSLRNFENFKKLYIKLIDNLMELYNIKDYNKEEELNEFYTYHKILKDKIINIMLYINKSIDSKKYILIEGANAAMLDIDLGTYPFVTSSSTTIGGIFSGLGIHHKKLNLVVGVVKSYLTRVGSGPFLTEQCNEIGEY
ncbi:adenylosuccinate synthetase, putative (ADSS), partial [Plasmodium ovale curtisi]